MDNNPMVNVVNNPGVNVANNLVQNNAVEGMINYALENPDQAVAIAFMKKAYDHIDKLITELYNNPWTLFRNPKYGIQLWICSAVYRLYIRYKKELPSDLLDFIWVNVPNIAASDINALYNFACKITNFLIKLGDKSCKAIVGKVSNSFGGRLLVTA